MTSLIPLSSETTAVAARAICVHRRKREGVMVPSPPF